MLFFFSPPSCAFDNGDFQYWNTESIEVKFAKKWKLAVQEEFRFGDNSRLLYYNHTDTGLAYGLNKYLSFSANYRQKFNRKEDKWTAIYMPHVDVSLKLDWRDFTFKDRNWFEYSISEHKRVWVYRNKFSLELPFKWTPFEIRPYGADEIFFDFNKARLVRNRVYAGFKMRFLENLKGELYYMCQTTRDKKWISYHILGTKLTVAF